jgi:hypothetical protein
MRVVSTRWSFFNGRFYRPGKEFDLPEGDKPSKAMTVVDEKAEPKKKEEPEPRKSRRRAVPVEPETLSEAAPFFDEEIKE